MTLVISAFRSTSNHRVAAGLAIGLFAFAHPHDAYCHERKTVGPLTLVIGWGEEPAFAGLKNSVEVDVADAAGAVADLGGSLNVEITFGEARVTAPLLPVRERPGKYRTWLVPTRPGTYSFHITGNARGQFIDVSSTCSNATFACVIDLSEIQFPAKDPSAGQLAERVARSLPRADRAVGVATNARLVAIGALVVSILSLTTALLWKRNRKPPKDF